MRETHRIEAVAVSASRPPCHLRWTVPVAAILLLGITFWQLPGRTLLLNELQNTGHTVLFGLLALLALCSYRAVASGNTRRTLWVYVAAGAGCLLTGIAVECVQYLTGGDADVHDVVRDLAGILAALCVWAAFNPRLSGRQSLPVRATLLASLFALVIASAWPLATLAWAYQQRARAFPVIAEPAAAWSAPFLHLDHARLERPVDTTTCAAPSSTPGLVRWHLAADHYAGFSVAEPQPDWRGYRTLVFELYSVQSDPFEIVLRVHDARHDQTVTDRFNRSLTVTPGQNRFRVPLDEIRDAPAGRRMDMAHIAGVMLFEPAATVPVSFCTGALRLE